MDERFPTISELQDRQRKALRSEFFGRVIQAAFIAAMMLAALIVAEKAFAHHAALTCGAC